MIKYFTETVEASRTCKNIWDNADRIFLNMPKIQSIQTNNKWDFIKLKTERKAIHRKVSHKQDEGSI